MMLWILSVLLIISCNMGATRVSAAVSFEAASFEAVSLEAELEIEAEGVAFSTRGCFDGGASEQE